MREALLYHRAETSGVVCDVCAHRCRVSPGETGLCGVRENRRGRFFTLSDDRLSSVHDDWIESGPFYHVLPGSKTLALSGIGDNFHCRYCSGRWWAQLPTGARSALPGAECSARGIVDRAARSGCRTVTFTHTEPTVQLELVLEVASLAQHSDIGVLIVTNGYMTAETIETVAPWITAASVGIRGFDDGLHRRLWGTRLHPVLDSIRRLKQHGVWVEVFTLILPGLSDSVAELSEIAAFLLEVGAETPWHLGAFPPGWGAASLEPGERFLLEHAVDIGRQAGLHHVYSVGSSGDRGDSTHCPSCGLRLVERSGGVVARVSLDRGRCPACGITPSGIWGDQGAWPERRTEEAGSWAGPERRAVPSLH